MGNERIVEEGKGRIIEDNAHDRVVARIKERKIEVREANTYERKQERQVRAEEKTRKREKKKEREISDSRYFFARSFATLAKRFFLLESYELMRYSDEELVALEKLIARRALAGTALSKTLAFATPVGWGALACYAVNTPSADQQNRYTSKTWHPRPSESWAYRYLRGKLQKLCGDDWFPFQEI